MSVSDNEMSESDNDFECTVCFESFLKKRAVPWHIKQCPNGHCVCAGCFRKLLGNPCPTCREVMHNIRNIAFENLIAHMHNQAAAETAPSAGAGAGAGAAAGAGGRLLDENDASLQAGIRASEEQARVQAMASLVSDLMDEQQLRQAMLESEFGTGNKRRREDDNASQHSSQDGRLAGPSAGGGSVRDGVASLSIEARDVAHVMEPYSTDCLLGPGYHPVGCVCRGAERRGAGGAAARRDGRY
jgi:hypothetical protein